MAYEPTTELLPVAEADAVKSKATSAMELFIIFPLIHGLMASAVIDEDDDYPAREFVIGGAVLVAGSYVAGRILYSRKLDRINETNAFLQEANSAATEHNLEVDRQIRQVHADAVVAWQREGEGRGIVVERTEVPAE